MVHPRLRLPEVEVAEVAEVVVLLAQGRLVQLLVVI